MTSEPPATTPRPSRAPRRALACALLTGALGAAVVLVAAGQVWSESTASFADGTLPLEAEGGDISGLPSALALVGLAALVAVFAVRRAVRFAVAGLLALCGAGTVVTAVLGANDTAALQDKAAQASGLASSGIGDVTHSVWPYLSAAGGVLLLVAGALALRYGRDWPSMAGSGRYERTPRASRTRSRAGGRAAAPPVDPDRPEDLWKALDRGEDPTYGTS
ncbi:TIGR02234 family membrane protein [Streptomyces armeniacus]|uniref:TIGR02234 family membrane protein n=1 Tax=Streptomyces armeniacus TaxID=83291 RepID=A0A345XWK7_9ACTN|nr:TIGR02234 family membrane protein [Streptomyces armeniacus]AXK36023.1 TIGR02234 family membrane protein [Streptomyces armeniacus]